MDLNRFLSARSGQRLAAALMPRLLQAVLVALLAGGTTFVLSTGWFAAPGPG